MDGDNGDLDEVEEGSCQPQDDEEVLSNNDEDFQLDQ